VDVSGAPGELLPDGATALTRREANVYSENETGRHWPVDREMFRIGAQMLLVEPGEAEEPAGPVVPEKREEVAVGAG
jgi:hypothetical protein